MLFAPIFVDSIQRLTLRFKDAEIEQIFRAYSLPRTLQQSRLAMVCGTLVFLAFGYFDPWFMSKDQQAEAWVIRTIAIVVPIAICFWTHVHHASFARWRDPALASVCLSAGVALTHIMYIIPPENVAHVFPSMVIVTFVAYNFIGARFVYGLAVDITLLVTYNLMLQAKGYPVNLIVSQDYFIVAANLMAGGAGYLAEYQRRQLFLQSRALDVERERHLSRSLHDPLTGLPNRESLFELLDHMLSQGQTDRRRHAGFFVDLDGFKAINDALGHAAGDSLLQTVSLKLRASTRKSDTAYRIGGDEFFILASGIDNEFDAISRAAELRAEIESTADHLPAGLSVSASIGVCLFPYEGATVSGVIQRADHAMYEAKRAGKARTVVTQR